MSGHTSDCTAVHFHDNPTDRLQHMAHTHEKTLFGSTTRRGARLAVRPNCFPPLNQEVCADNWYYPEDKRIQKGSCKDRYQQRFADGVCGTRRNVEGPKLQAWYRPKEKN